MQDNHVGPSSYKQGAKVAISKLDRGPPPPSQTNDKPREDRVSRACKLCRKRKVRCSGNLPQCTNCHVNNATCIYEQGRRDRLKDAMLLNQTYATLLRDISGRVDGDDRRRIDEALENAEEDLISCTPVQSVKSLGKRARKHSSQGDDDEKGQHGEAFVTASVGSNEDLDFLGEDILRSRQSRETGYIGQNSEVQWLRSVQRQAERGNTDPLKQRYGPPGSSRGAINERSDALHERRRDAKPGRMGHITDASFYLDSEDMEIDVAVDPYDIPEPETAQQLFNCYMKTVHSSFPLMPITFEDQFRRYMESLKQNKPYQVPEKWRATMNLIFAIGAKYSHLIGAEWRGDERDHLVYMTRATHLLGLKNTVMIISGPDLGLVQATGTLAFYFLVIGHVSRAWIMIGVSIRLALALGLHLRNEDPSADLGKREALARTWWSLHTIECLVSSITGRPPVLAIEDCTVSLPLDLSTGSPSTNKPERASRMRKNYDSPQSSTSSSTSETRKQKATETRKLHMSIQLSLISQKALLSLYSPRTAVQSWEYIQTKIKELLAELEEWAKLALADTDPAKLKSGKAELDRDQFLLKIDYWSTKILITRPCLCRIERRISHESDNSVNFNVEAAETCVKAARVLTSLFPDQPDTSFIYSQGPWWNAIHIIMQSTAVLLLEMAYEGKHIKDEEEDIVTSIKKMIRWLRAMQANDPIAARAYNVLWTILKNCTPALQSKANELLAEDVEPSQHPSSSHSYHPQAEHYQDDLWPPMDFAYGQTADEPAFDPQLLPPQATDSLFEPGSDSYPYYTSAQYQMPTTFGNPFYTSFDQGAPVMNMQDLWMNPSSAANVDTDFAAASFQQQQQQQQQQLQNQAMQQMHHTMQNSRETEQVGLRYSPYQHLSPRPS